MRERDVCIGGGVVCIGVVLESYEGGKWMRMNVKGK